MVVETISNNTNELPRKKIKFSGIDLLKIIAILLICFSHANQTLKNNIVFPYGSISYIVSTIFTPFGTFGNILFIICSAYFMVDKPKVRGEKVFNLLFDAILISNIMLIGFVIGGYRFDTMTIIHQIFPDVFMMNWFVPAYLLFYILSPLVVFLLRKLNAKTHLITMITCLFLCIGLTFLNQTAIDLFQFFYILIVVSYFKWYHPNASKYILVNVLTFVLGIILFYLCYFGYLKVATVEPFSYTSFPSLYTSILVFSLFALFNLFKEFKIQSKAISYLSQCSLFVYLIHENDLLRRYTRVEYYQLIFTHFGTDLAIVWMLLCGIFMFVVGFILAVIYKESLGRLTSLLADKFFNLLKKLFCKFISIFKKKEATSN